MATKATRKAQALASVSDTDMKAASNSEAMKQSIIDAAKHEIDATIAREVQSIKATQFIAYQIFRYREMVMADDTAVKSWAELAVAGSEARRDWMNNYRTQFVGKSVTRASALKSQDGVKAFDLYNKRRAVFDNGANFAIAAGNHGVTAKQFIESLSCFAIPGTMLLPKDKAWRGMFELADAIESKSFIPLDNTRYMIAASTKDTDFVYASVAQVMRVWNEKPKATKTTTTTNADGTKTETTVPVKGASNTGSYDPKVIKDIMSKASIDSLAKQMWIDLNADPKVPMDADSFEPDTWNTMLNIAARINAMAATKAQKSGNKPADTAPRKTATSK